MKRLVFIVEGDTEVVLIENLVVPYLYSKGYKNAMHAQTINTNRKQHKKGGITSYGKFKNEIERTLAQENVIVTTLIDFFKLPTDFPGFLENSHNIALIEEKILDDFGNNENLIPYIQKYEIEALMFSNISGFQLLIDDEKKLKK